MAAIWYRVQKYHNKIEPVEVVKETGKFVVIEHKGFLDNRPYTSREAKVSEYSSYFPYYGDARQKLLERLSTHIAWMETDLVKKKQELQILSETVQP